MVDKKFFENKGFVVSTVSPSDIGMEFDYKGFDGYLSLAENDGLYSVELAFRIAHEVYNGDVKFYAHLVLALNHRLWFWYEKGSDNFAKLYDKLWRFADSYASQNFKGADARYYFEVTD